MERFTGSLMILLTALLSLSPPAAGAGSPQPKERLLIAGTGSSTATMRRMGEIFSRLNPAVTIEVLPSIGSTGGIKAVREGRIAVGLSSRPLKADEQGTGIVAEPYGLTAFVFGVQASNPVTGLTLAEIEEIYAGRRRTWSDGTPIRLILRPQSDAHSTYLGSINPRLKSASEQAHFIPGIFVGLTDQEAADQIEKTPGSFGTTSASLVAAEKRKIKPLSVDGAAPLLANIAAGRDIAPGQYPYVLTLYLVYRRDASSSAVKAFIDFLFSREGREHLAENGHAALPRRAGK